MKKLLTAFLAIVMGATLVGALAACTSGADDAETAKKAMDTVRSMYGKKEGEETSGDWKVIGKSNVDGTLYDVTYSVSSEYEGYQNYVSVGTELDDNQRYTISITKAPEAIEYTLTASVTVGKATETESFKRKIPAKPAAHDGTLASPYSCANVAEIAATMTPKAKLEESDNPVAVYVKGYIVDCGTDQTSKGNNRVGYVYIVDEYSPEKTSKSPDAIMILSINYGDILTGYADLEKGAEIIVKGYIMNYQKAGSTTEQAEVTYYGSNGVTCEYYKKIELTDAQKVAAAELEVALAKTTYTTANEVVNLPTESNGATLSWKVKGESSVVSVADNKLRIGTIPQEATTVTLTVTITAGEESAEKDFEITVKMITLEHAGTQTDPYSIADAQAILGTLAAGERYKDGETVKQVFISGFVTVAGTVGDYGYNNVYIGATADATQEDSILIYSCNWNTGVLEKTDILRVGDEVVVRGYFVDYNGTKEIADNGAKSKDYPVFVSRMPVTKTDAFKVEDALYVVSTSLDTITATGEVALPVSTVTDVTFTWTLAEGTTAASLSQDGTKLVVDELPTENVTVTLTVTATCGEVSTNNTKQVTVIIAAPLTGNSAKLDFSSVTEKGTAVSGDITAAFNTYGGTAAGLIKAEASGSVYKGNGSGLQGDGYQNVGGLIKFGTSSKTGTLKLTFSKAVTKVEIKCRGWEGGDIVTINNGTAQKPGTTVTTLTFDLATAATEVTIVVNKRALFFEIVVYFAEEESAQSVSHIEALVDDKNSLVHA